MDLMQKFDQLTDQRRELKKWWAMKDQLATYNQENYALRVDFVSPKMVAFCGQQNAGGQNYHDAPAFFVDEIVRVAAALSQHITQEAYNAAMLKFDKEIASLKADILGELDKSEAT